MTNIDGILRRTKKLEGLGRHPPLIIWKDVYGIEQVHEKELELLPGQEVIEISWMKPDDDRK